MEQRTTRRAALGGLAVAGVGGAGYLLRPTDERRAGNWLHPTDSIAHSDDFAHVSGVVRQGRVMAVQVAMRETTIENIEIVLFAESDDPVVETMIGPRGFWRFDVDVSGRTPGEYVLAVGDDRLSVTLETDAPTRLRNPRLQITTQGVWRSSHVAHAYGYDTGPETGRLEIAFRQRVGSAAVPIDALDVLTPAGDRIGSHSLSEGVYEATLRLDPFEPFEDGLGMLRAFHDGDAVDGVHLLTY
jgi:hypothetical protein